MATTPAATSRRPSMPVFDYYPRRAGLWAIGLGLASATGFEPVGIWVIGLLAMALFVLLVARAPGVKSAAWLGWLFGWAHFTFSNNWIAASFTHQAEMPAALGWAAVPLLAVYLAVYPALAALVTRAAVRSGPGWGFALIFAGAWIVTEWMRGWVFTGYSWNPFAMVLLGDYERSGLAALSPIMGTYALSGVAIFLASAVLLLDQERRGRVALLVAALVAIAMYWPASWLAPEGREGTLAVTIAKPNIPQADISDPRAFETNFQRLAELSPRRDESGAPRLLLWPESGMADYLREGYPQRYYDRTTAMGSPVFARQRLGRVAGEGSVLLTGAVDLEIGEDENGYARAIGARNAVTALDAEGTIIGSYAKAHLVPYGEYLPLRTLLEPLGLSRLVAGTIDFWPGPGPRTLDLGEHGRVGVQVCYEIAFPGEVVERGNRPDFILNPSSEAWFGSFAPPQFLAQSRMRAIEEGLPVVRATNSGISAVIDARGVVREYLPSHIAGRIDAVVPPALPPTLFAWLGNGLSLGWALLFILIGGVAMRRASR